MPTYTFDTLYDRKTKRPDDYGVITVQTEVTNPGTFYQRERQTLVYGYIHPLDTTSGRKSAPEPFSNFRIGATKRIPKKAKLISPRNTGKVDMDKGHIIALELGGPDVPANICPQWSQFQRNGEWRKMEVEAHGIAMTHEANGDLVFMKVALIYGDSSSFTRQLCPARFDVELTLNDTSSRLAAWSIENTHSDVDDKLAFRVMDELDKTTFASSPAPSYGAPPSFPPPPSTSFGAPPVSRPSSIPGFSDPMAQQPLTQQIWAQNWQSKQINWQQFANQYADDDEEWTPGEPMEQ
ncbi:MAG: DNA/RNA non-specific endonuclease [Pseudomonadota bacterium]